MGQRNTKFRRILVVAAPFRGHNFHYGNHFPRLAMAAERRQAGRLQEAEQICRRILDAEPAEAGAWHLLGIVAYQLGRREEAVECLRRAIARDAGQAAFHDSLGSALQEQGNLDEAVACYRRALELNPGGLRYATTWASP